MAEAKKDTKDKTLANTSTKAPAKLGVSLKPVADSDQPVVANYSSLNVSQGIAFIDFGFLEPGLLASLPRMARAGGKLPEQLNGKLAVRVAMGFEALAGLHQQLGQVLKNLSDARAAGRDKNPSDRTIQ